MEADGSPEALVGRERVQAALAAALDAAFAGSARLVVLTGEPGAGKTALARWLVARARRHGATVAWGQCSDADGAPGFWPWSQILRDLSLGDALAAPADGADPGGARFRLFADVAQALARLAGQRPLVLVVDDLQWADAGSWKLLDFLARHERDDRVLILATLRDTDPAPTGLPRPAEYLSLTGLTVDDVAAVLSGLGVSRDAAPAVHRRSGGNPFFVHQIGRLLAARPDAEDVPAVVTEAVAARLAALPPACVAVLEPAALIGTTFDGGLLATVVGADPDLAPALRARIVEPATDPYRYRFAHDLFRETLVQRLPGEARRRWHAALTTALASREDTDPAELAHHAERGVPRIPAERAVAHAVDAARAAQRRLAYEEAVRLWQQAVRIAHAAGQRVPDEHRLELAEAQRRAGDHSGAWAGYRAIADATGDPVVRGRVAFGLHQLGHGSEHSRVEVVRLLQRSNADLPAGALRARLMAALARELADGPEHDHAAATRLAEEAVAMAREVPDRTVLAFCLFAQHDVMWAPGNAAQRLALADEMAACATGDAELAFEAAFCRFSAQINLGDPSAAATLRELDRLAGASRLPRQRYLVTSRQATLAAMRGDFAAAERLIQAAADLGAMIGEPDTAGVQVTQLLVLGLTRDGFGAAVHVEQSFGAATPSEFAPETQAWASLAAGDAEAAAAVMRASPPATQRAWYRWRQLAALAFNCDIAAACGAADLAEAAYTALLPYADEVVTIGGAAAVVGPASLYLGVSAATAGRGDAAIEHLTAALATAQRVGARPLAARARAELGLALVGAGDTRRGQRLLAEAGQAADELGLAPVRARIAAGAPPENVFARAGDVWTLTYAGRTVHMRDTKGLADLAVLVGSPGRAVPATELLAGGPAPRMGADEVLDARARAEYRARIGELDTLIAAADDAALARKLETERAAIIDELARAVGLRARSRRLGDPVEKARTTVTARIRDSLRRVEELHPELGRHLRESVNTGRTCSYRPAARVRWRLSNPV